MAYWNDFGVTPEGEEITRPCPARDRVFCKKVGGRFVQWTLSRRAAFVQPSDHEKVFVGEVEPFLQLGELDRLAGT